MKEPVIARHTAGRKRWLPLAGCLLSLAACSLLPSAEPVVIHRYTLDRPPPDKRFDPGGPAILVAAVRARPGSASRQIMYRRGPSEAGYYTRSRWLAPPADMLQPLVVDALEGTARFRAVAQPGDTIAADLRLDLELVELYHDVSSDPGSVQLRVRARLQRMAPPAILATKQFAYAAPVVANNAASAVDAVDSLLDELLREVAQFCVDESTRSLAGSTG